MGRNVTVGYQDASMAPLFLTNALVERAREMGMDTVWLPDHWLGFAPKWLWKPEICAGAAVIHSGDAFFDPIALMGYLAARFPGLRLGTSVTEPIRRHPISLAQSFVTLDHLTEGNAILGIGNGLRENTEPYGLPAERRVSRLAEALEIIRALFASKGEPVAHEGEFWQFDGAVFDLPLYEGRAPRVFIGAHAPRMLRLTGRFADGWLPGQVIPAEEYGRRLDIIRAAAEDAGRRMDGFLATQTVLLVLGENRETVLDQAMQSPYVAYNALGLPGSAWRARGLDHPLGDDFIGQLDLVPPRIGPDLVAQSQERMTRGLLEEQYYFGTPAQVAEQLQPLTDVGCGHFVLANLGGNFTRDQGDSLEHMARLTGLLKSM